MKKISILLLLSAMLSFYSCDMDKFPYGQLEENIAIKNITDCTSYRNGLYISLRSATSGAYVTYSDIQMDYFHGSLVNDNRVGEFYSGTLQPSTSDITSIWGGFYGLIASSNFFIEKLEGLIGNKEFSENEQLLLKRYLGETLFTRAYSYAYLVDKFCPSYVGHAQESTSGLPLVTKYAPTSDSSKHPGRSSLEETYTLIKNDLDRAKSLLLEYEKTDAKNAPVAMSNYVTSDVVKALESRIALNIGDYDSAISIAEGIIDSGTYPLATVSSLPKLWSSDTGTEALWLVEMTITELGGASGENFLNTSAKVDYLPTQATINLYSEKDARFDAYFIPKELQTQAGKITAYAFSKYPGNPKLYNGQSNFTNMMKPFRTAELYLIVAEAAMSKSPADEIKANKRLNELKAKRISKYSSKDLSGQELINEIRAERQRELIGEGFRLGDLKRWKLGFTRSEKQEDTDNFVNTVGGVDKLSYEASDHRFTWPIPKAELDANPQIRNQQNPGY